MALVHFSVALAQKVKVGATVHKGASNAPERIFPCGTASESPAVSLASPCKQFTEEDFPLPVCCSVMPQL